MMLLRTISKNLGVAMTPTWSGRLLTPLHHRSWTHHPIKTIASHQKHEPHRQRNTSIKSSPTNLASVLVNSSPQVIRPYLKLARMDYPIGTWLLFWPCAWSIGLATPSGQLPDLGLLSTFALGAFVMRGAGCTINDMWDKDIDTRVDRTRTRPLASGQLSTFQALTFLNFQLSAGLLILLQLNDYSVLLGASSMVLVVLYPLTKRLSHWPQLMLGLTFNWGALLGWSAVTGSCQWSAVLPLYLASVCWTIIYDTIYAHQDKVDDLVVGVKSTALLFGDKTKSILTGFSAVTLTGLLTSGVVCDQTWPFFLACSAVGAHIAYQLKTLDLNNPGDCKEKFVSNKQVGLLIFLGILAGTYLKESVPQSQPRLSSLKANSQP